MLHVYNTVLFPLRAVVGLWAGWHGRDRAGAEEWAQRRARVLPRVPPGGLWLHGSSVGEARIVKAVSRRFKELRPTVPISVSAYTRTGRGQLPGPPAVDAAFFVPLDFSGLPGRLLDALRPTGLVLVETELWPNLLHEAGRRGVRVVLINGRLAPSRMGRYRRLSSLYRPLLERLERVGAQSAGDAERFVRLGVPPGAVTVTGNIKYDLPTPQADPERLRKRFAIDEHRPVLAAGSTGAGEEMSVLTAAQQVRRRFPELFLILAPRHPERALEVERLAADRGFRLHRVSSGSREPGAATDGLLVDTIGELAGLYSICRAAFVGGSLVRIGGHNLLEPVAVGAPVLFGPHTEHVADTAEALLHADAAVRVADAQALAAAWTDLLADPERGRRIAGKAAAVLADNRGALDRSLTILEDLLPGDGR